MLLTALIATPTRPAAAQDRPLEVSGNVYAGFNGTHDSIDPSGAAIADPIRDFGKYHEVDLGVDLHVGYYIVTPKFITLNADLDFSTLKSSVDGQDSGRGVRGQSYGVNVLPNSPYPFRFLYSMEDSDYSQQSLTNLKTHNRDLRWDWQLRLRAFPRITVTYDSREDQSGYFTNPLQTTKGRGLTVTGSYTLKGWDLNASYDDHTAEYALAALTTSYSTQRFDARKSFTPDQTFTTHASHQTTNFEEAGIVTGQNYSFFDIRSEYNARLTKRLTLDLYHQYFSNSSVTAVALPAQTTASKGLFAPADSMTAPRIADAPVPIFAPLGSDALSDISTPTAAVRVPGGWTGMFAPSSPGANPAIVTPGPTPTVEVATQSNTFGAQLSYVLLRNVSVGGGASYSTINPPNGPLLDFYEQATRLLDAQANVNYGQRLGPVSVRANVTYGLSSSKSNLGNTGRGPFYSGSGGLSIGNSNRLMVWADANYLHREDIYFTNGYANEHAYQGGLEAQLLPSLHLTGTAGVSNFDEVTPDGHQNYRRTLYSLGLDHRIVTFQISQSTNVGDRDVFTVPFDLGVGRLFYLLPIDSLVPDPLGRTWSRYTQGVLRFRLVRDLDLEARYIDNDSQFVAAQDVTTRQLEVLATYRLGKFTFRAGALVERLAIEGSPTQRRTQYFARVSRAFRMF